MKTIGIILIVLGVLGIGYQITRAVLVSYSWNNQFGGYWSLADKSSTIEKKSEYIDKFVAALEKSGSMVGNNAIFLKTPDNDVVANFNALKSLQSRLQEIKGMDVTSFQYQQAIQQITDQEQGQAGEMLSALEGGWKLHSSYWVVWSWIAVIYCLVMITFIVVGAVIISL